MNIRVSALWSRALLRGSAFVAFVILSSYSLFAAEPIIHQEDAAEYARSFNPLLPVEPMILTSASKQFVVKGKPQRSVFASSARDDQIYVNPTVLAVGCERIKEAVARELGWIDRWRGTIFVNVHPLRFDNERPELQAFLTSKGWRYRLEMPDQISRALLIEAVVEALLVEFADRAATEHSVELPPWLAEGLAAHLMEGSLSGLTLQPNATNLRHNPRNDPVAPLRAKILERGVLSVDQLNWPEFEWSDRPAVEAYHYSAHLFVREMLRLPGGPDLMSATLALLPEHLNWQRAFLRGFDTHFHRMLDVEKWWALQLTRLKTHDTKFAWSVPEAQQKLEEVLYTPMQVRLGPDELPHVTPVALQTVINDWNFQQQVPLLQKKIIELSLMRLHLPGELGSVSDSYRSVMQKYLQGRSKAWFGITARGALREAIAQFNALDAQREKMTLKSITSAAPSTADEPGAVVPLTPQ
jgi:hypothetical protein